MKKQIKRIFIFSFACKFLPPPEILLSSETGPALYTKMFHTKILLMKGRKDGRCSYVRVT